MLTQKLLKLFLSILVILPFLNACGGGGGGGKDNSPPSRQSGTISGVVFDAPVSGATVKAYEFRGASLGRLLGKGKTDDFGQYSIEIKGAASTPIMIRSEGGKYFDSYQKKYIGMSNFKLRSVVNYEEGNDHTAMITPLTNIAAGLATYRAKRGTAVGTAISQSLQSLKEMYGFDVNETRPNDLFYENSKGTSEMSYQYGAVLAAFSSIAETCRRETGNSVCTSIELAEKAYQDIVGDGILDGKHILEEIKLDKLLNSETYTSELAFHLLKFSANSLNKSGKAVDYFEDYSNILWNIGKNDDSSLVGKRTDTCSDGLQYECADGGYKYKDQTPPEVKRVGNNTLVGDDTVTFEIRDHTGIAPLSVELNVENDTYQCGDASDVCSFTVAEGDKDTAEKEDIVLKILKVNVKTKAFKGDRGDLILQIALSDVLQNKEVKEFKSKWNNVAPVISYTELLSTMVKLDDNKEQYTLEGHVHENKKHLKNPDDKDAGEVKINFQGETQPQYIECESFGDKRCFFKDYKIVLKPGEKKALLLSLKIQKIEHLKQS